jgi:hypothetical protein
MKAEFRVTSEFRELAEIAEARNASPEWRGVLEIKPSVNRVVRLRGRSPDARDIADIHYDLADFAQIEMPFAELVGRLSMLTELESTYYPLAENYGTRTALSLGKYVRIPDFIDKAKAEVERIVWFNWKPEKGENFMDLHARVVARLKRHLAHAWGNANGHLPFSFLEADALNHATSYSEIESMSPKMKPQQRLRLATSHLSLPSIVATIDSAPPIEKIASLSLIGYYPDGRGLSGVAQVIGVKRETLSAALDRTLERLVRVRDEMAPQRGIKQIVEELVNEGVMHYPSGKNVERTNPRLSLLRQIALPEGLSERERDIFIFSKAHSGHTFTYTSGEIAKKLGIGKPLVCRVIKRIARSLQQDRF